MEIDAEQKTETVVSIKTKTLAIISVIITFVAWPLSFLGIKETHVLYVCWVIWLCACLCGIMSLKSMNNIKGFRWIRLVAWLGCVFSIFFALGTTFIVSDGHAIDRIFCSDNLRVLDRSIRTYCEKHEDKFPDPSKWCDLLLSEPKNKSNDAFDKFWELSEKKFRCPTVTEGRSGYAFNKNLAGKRISEVDPNTVVLFETTATGWNQNGSPELMCPDRHKRIFGEGGSYVVCVGKDKPVVRFVPQSEVKNLRWEP